MSEGNFFIDANIPMYARGGDHPLKAPCLSILAKLAHGELLGVTSVEVVQEIAHRYSLTGQRSRARSVAEDFLLFIPRVLPITVEDMEWMLANMDRYAALPARDLLHVAVMLNNDISAIISADAHFDVVLGIKRYDPRDFEPGVEPAATTR